MSHSNVKVRTVRPHDTVDGMKAPGDEYERTKSDADALAKLGIIEIVSARASKAK